MNELNLGEVENKAKTFRLGYDAKAYNARLREAREKMGLSKKEMARFLGVTYGYYCHLERMRVYPGKRLRERIEATLGQLWQELFPEEIRRFAWREVRVEKDVPVSLLSLENREVLALPAETSIEEEVELRLMREELDKLLGDLAPRERDIIRLRYGLADGQERTLREVGEIFRVGGERIRQIEIRAIKKLKRLAEARHLLEET